MNKPFTGRSRESSPHWTKWETLSQRTKYYIPALKWMPSYSSSWSAIWFILPLNIYLRKAPTPIHRLAGDIAAGVSVASVIIPQSMSYATSLAHVNASCGLLASAIPGIVYSMFGTCAHLNVGPEAALSLLVGQAISAIVQGDPHDGKGLVIASAVSTMITFQVREFGVMSSIR